MTEAISGSISGVLLMDFGRSWRIFFAIVTDRTAAHTRFAVKPCVHRAPVAAGVLGVGMTHVIADDNSVFRSSLRRILGPGAKTAATPDEAVELVAEQPPAVVVMDVCFKTVFEDGIEAIPRIKLLSPATQIVVCTGFYSEADAARARRYGAYAYIEKMHITELVATIAAASAYAVALLAQLAA